MCFSKIRRIFSKLKPKKEAAKERPLRKWWQFPFRLISTKRLGLNMPKYQFCPRCHAESKRLEKTTGGADYFCRNHRGFFVRI